MFLQGEKNSWEGENFETAICSEELSAIFGLFEEKDIARTQKKVCKLGASARNGENSDLAPYQEAIIFGDNWVTHILEDNIILRDTIWTELNQK